MISVFGGTGFIGSRYCQNNNDAIVIARDSFHPLSDEIIYMISTIDNYNVFDKPLLDIETNLVHLVKVLENCKNNKNTIFNFISSWFVYGKTKDLPAHEESTCNPTGFYSITKYAAEKLIASYCETFGLKYRILRLCNVYGEGDEKVSKKKNAMQFLVNEIIEGRDVNLYNKGQNIRDFMHVEDVCKGISTALQKLETNTIINIGSGKPAKIIDIVNYVKEKVNSKSKFNFIETPEFHKVVQIEDMYLDVTKLKKLGFEQNISMSAGLDLLINRKISI